MMPPKKSKAARQQQEEPAPAQTNGVAEDSKAPGPSGKADQAQDEDMEDVNIFKVEILDSKRDRPVRKSTGVIKDWLNEHLEEKEDYKISTFDLYSAYVETCISGNLQGEEQPRFTKELKEAFPKGFTCKESSQYKEDLKDRKMIKKKKPSGAVADSCKLKMRDIIEAAIKEAGNPRKGLRFQMIQKLLGAKYPALRIDLKPKMLKSALIRGANYGHVECVRGVGQCGFYRLPGDPEGGDEEEQEEETKSEKPKKKTSAKKAKDGEEGKEEGAGDGEKKGGDDEKKEGEEGEKTEGGGEGEEKKKKKGTFVVPKPYDRKRQERYRSHLVHGEPEKIEDSFPMAMTFMSEPKEASFKAIKKYIIQHYNPELTTEKLLKTMQSGAEKSYWEAVVGSGASGSYQLLFEEFDPTADDDMVGMITNAIVACVEPKQCSGRLLKEYVIEYHPEFKVADKPWFFKRALERGILKNLVHQITGIGSTGSFKLSYTFAPSPAALRGEDTSSDYEDEPDDDDKGKVINEDKQADIGLYRDAYVPRPSKRHSRKSAVMDLDDRQIDYSVPKPRSRKPAQPKVVSKKGKGKAVAAKSKAKAGRGGRASASQATSGGRKRKVEESSDEEDKSSSEEEKQESSSNEEDSDEEYGAVPEYRPRSKKRGAPKSRGTPPPPKKKGKAAAPTPKGGKKGKAAAPTPKGGKKGKAAGKAKAEPEPESEPEQEPESEPEPEPEAKPKRPASAKKGKGSSRRRSRK